MPDTVNTKYYGTKKINIHFSGIAIIQKFRNYQITYPMYCSIKNLYYYMLFTYNIAISLTM